MALIILAHPRFNSSLANKTIMEELQSSSEHHEIRNIHSLYPDYKIDVLAEQEALLRHGIILLQYPFYWLNLPAILKHWIDEVFAYQFAYGSQGDKLKGKNLIPSFTVGAAEKEYLLSGKHHMRIYEFCKSLEHTAYYAQMNYIDPICFFGASLNVEAFTEEEVKRNAQQHAQKIIKILKDPEPAPVAVPFE
ncbi:NAD(P)H-dependent oxidoreductase [Mucilaginibacter robiniae]|uniref:NAD(P)H-dependent oxidoreductase n=1 Tax=Mucilaginibacter robiniae TaxID=2728022 RepID=A0A7L5E0U8_9SPHI|nr:NAD(P)H-dependent oxidoreductase [Mucilaginibacter robiniae]QJD96651.1 NAD(P)H-dependent oxidoreductase [Mucilaginibacter robiniae]